MAGKLEENQIVIRRSRELFLQPNDGFRCDAQRVGFARDVTSARGTGNTAFRPEKLISLGLSDPTQILNAVTDLLGVTDQMTDADKAPLIDYLTDNGASTSLNLNDSNVRNTKLNGLFALILESPAYQLH